ncbi:MAG: phage major capsid protein [Chloroflexi bacterium]|nr:MAG: phage major capsid protein [Chloroflexota bacterium]
MTQLLIRALEAANAGPSEKKVLQEKIINRDLAAFERVTGKRYIIEGEDGKKHPARELLLSEAVETGTLVQTEINRTILEGAEPARCMRDAVPIFPMKSNVMQINIGDSGRYAPFVGEGSEYTIRNQDYTARTWTAKKIGEIPLCTKEMVDDALFAVVEMEVRKAGEACENTLNQWMLATLLDNAGNEYDINAAVAALGGAAAIREAKALIAADGFHADKVIYHPQVETYICKDYTPIAYNPVAQEQMRTGLLPMILGCRLYECGVDVSTTSAPTASTYVWGAPDNGYIGMCLIDTAKCGGIGMRQDLFVEDYRDPLRDLVSGKVSMRVACQYGLANAISRVEYGGA